MIKALLIGFGNIGKIHAKYLEKNKIDWSWSDLDKNAGPHEKYESLNRINEYTHVFICTPEETHINLYDDVVKNRQYRGKIFIEKPVVISHKDFNVFSDVNVFSGVVERFNPAVQALSRQIDPNKVINVDFSRCCSVPGDPNKSVSIVEDLGIHDLDILCFLLKVKNPDISKQISSNGKTCALTLAEDQKIYRFLWSQDTYYKERKIWVRQNDCTFVADLIEQSVKKYESNNQISVYVEKSSSIENEQRAFFEGKICNSRDSHNLMLRVLSEA